jgi:ATP/ADP translocase
MPTESLHFYLIIDDWRYRCCIFAPAFALAVASLVGTTPLMLTVLMGATQNILRKSSKYSLFILAKKWLTFYSIKIQKQKGDCATSRMGS